MQSPSLSVSTLYAAGLSQDDIPVLHHAAESFGLRLRVIAVKGLSELERDPVLSNGGLIVVNQFSLSETSVGVLTALAQLPQWQILGIVDAYFGTVTYQATSHKIVRDLLQLPWVVPELHWRLGSALERLDKAKTAAESENTLAGNQRRQNSNNRRARELLHLWLPDSSGECLGQEYHLYFEPAAISGGDFCQVLPLSHRHLALVMVDVAGHGLASTFTGINVIEWMTDGASAHLKSELGDPYPPAMVADRLQNSIPGLGPEEGRYFTLFYGVLDTVSLEFSYVRAGHEPLLLSDSSGVRAQHEGSAAIGLIPNVRFVDQTLTLEPGTKLFVYTDGLTDYENTQAERFGDARLNQSIELHSLKPISAAVPAVLDDVKTWALGGYSRDDICLLGLEIRPQHQPQVLPQQLIDIQIPARLPAASALAKLVEASLDSLVAADLAQRARLVLMEWLSNIIRHGFESQVISLSANTKIHVQAELVGGGVELVVRDSGRAFDPMPHFREVHSLGSTELLLQYDESNHSLHLGLEIIAKLCESVAYDRSANGINRMTMSLR